VVGVSKRAEATAATPATVTVLTQDDFARHAWLTVADALRFVPGLHVSWGRDHYYVGVRGLSFPTDVNTRLLVLLDGHTLNDPRSGAADVGELLAAPLEAVARIEVIRGPASSVYGSNAFLAVVNVVSRRGVDLLHGGAARAAGSVTFGSTRLGRAVLSGGQRFGGVEAGLFAVGLGGRGPEVTFRDITRPGRSAPGAVPSGGVTSETDYERGYHVGGSLAWHGLTLQLRAADRVKGLPSARGGAIFDDPYNGIRDAHAWGELRWQRPLGDHAVLVRAYHDRFHSQEFVHRDPTDWPVGTWLSANPHVVTEGRTEVWGGEARLVLQLHEDDNLIVGGEVQRQRVTQRAYELVTEPEMGLEIGEPHPDTVTGGVRDESGEIPPISSWNVAAYLQNEWRPTPSFAVVLGGRLDVNTIFTSTGSADGVLDGAAPRVALLYRPGAQGIVRLLYGEAFRNPTLFEVYFDDAATLCGNPDAGPERARTIELSGTWYLRDGLELYGSAYGSRLKDLLVRRPVPACYAGSGPRLQFQNQGNVDVVGAEVGGTFRCENGRTAFGWASLAYARARLDEARTGAPANSPRLVAGGGLAEPLWRERLVLSLTGSYLSERLNWTLDESRPEAAYLRVDAAVVVRRLFAGAYASLRLTNLFDLSYRDPVTSQETIPTAIPQDGLAIHGTIGADW
jgi:iron complex outermembrane receptor protein